VDVWPGRDGAVTDGRGQPWGGGAAASREGADVTVTR
jgi:hypothetical protein